MTNGKYTLADYTKMNTLFGARITALEKAVAFNPNNVTISGYVNVQPNASNSGTLQTAGGAQIGGNLQVNKSLTVTENAYIGGSLQVSGALSFASLAVNTFTSNTINNSGLTTSNSFSGNGAALTAVPAVSVPYSGLTGAVPTWNQNTTGNALTATTATNMAYSGLTGAVPIWNQSTTGNAATATNVAYSGLTGAVPTWNQNTTGNALTATSTPTATNATNTTNVIGGGAGRVIYGTGVSLTGFTGVGTVGQVLTSQGAATPTWTTASTTDVTKVPLAGGTMTGVLAFTSGGLSYATNYKRDSNYGWDNPVLGTFTPSNNLESVHDYYRINFANGPCTIDLKNLTVITATRQDTQRKVTIVKKAMALGDYVVTLLPPTGYFFYDAANNGAASTTIPLGRFSATYIIAVNAFASVVDLVAFS
jgi:hypothetical protein